MSMIVTAICKAAAKVRDFDELYLIDDEAGTFRKFRNQNVFASAIRRVSSEEKTGKIHTPAPPQLRALLYYLR